MYRYLPTWAQDIAVSGKGVLTRYHRYDAKFRRLLRGYLERAAWTSDQILEYRDRQLARSLERASRSAYYRDVFRSMGAQWQDFSSPTEFATLPVVTKAELVEDIDRFRPRPPISSDQTIGTSGTTGTSLSFPVSSNVEKDQWAVWWRYRAWHGIERGERCGLFASAPVVHGERWSRPYRVDWVNRDVRFSIFHVSDQSAPRYVAALDRTSVSWIHGNPTAIALLAWHMNEQGLKLARQLRWVTVGSENLLPWQRQAIINAFGCAPIQHYGLAEAVANISECPHGNLHVDEDFSYLELVEQDDDGLSAIVGTSFSNDAVSVLRYHTGDLVRLKDGRCSCGRWGRLVDSLDGRLTDYVVLPGGKRVASLAAPFHATKGLRAAQLYQAPTGDLVVRYVPAGAGISPEALSGLERELRLRVGQAIAISFEQWSDIPRTKRGKTKLVVSDYPSDTSKNHVGEYYTALEEQEAAR